MKYILKSTIRNFIRKPATNLINLLGLAISLALVIILSVYCYSELTTDNFHKNGDRVYLFSKKDNKIYSPAILKDQIDLSVPAVESTVRIAPNDEMPVFQVGDRDPIPNELLYADKDFFKLFTYNGIEGNLEQALNEPMTAVITKSLAEKLFGNEPAVGKTFKINNQHQLTVSAVVEPVAANSGMTISAVTSMESRKILQPNEGEFKEWGWNNFQTFVLLKEGASFGETAKQIFELVPKRERDDWESASLIPFKKLYFTNFTLYGSDYLRHGDFRKIMILLVVAGLVLLVALVNFINISSSQWHEKIRQTGVMKVIGARQSTLVGQVIVQAFLFFLVSLVISTLLIGVFMPFIANYTGICFNIGLLYSFPFFLISISATFILSSVFSIVPAIRISSSNAVDNLRKATSTKRKSPGGMGILVTAQFVIAIVLVAFTLLVQKQVNFGSSILGFNQVNNIGIKITPELGKKKEVIKKLLENKPGVQEISMGQYFPGKLISSWGVQVEIEGEKKQVDFDTFSADAGIFNILGLELIQGRFYSGELESDAHKVVVNESFVLNNKLQNPIGGKFYGWGGYPCEIIGVVKDFHYKSSTEPITALAIRNDDFASYCLVNLQTADFGSLHRIMQEIAAETSKLSPAFPVEISFFDQAVEKMYQSELQFRRTFTLFAVSAIVICCMGILAMSLFASQRRIKEIGIRKVNGARISEVIAMLNRDFVKWVAVAFVIATPIAYYAMNKWLEGFAYKTELSWWIFALAGLLALGIALLTVSWQSWRAATRNPVEALRYE